MITSRDVVINNKTHTIKEISFTNEELLYNLGVLRNETKYDSDKFYMDDSDGVIIGQKIVFMIII